jgi:hypothetical protein
MRAEFVGIVDTQAHGETPEERLRNLCARVARNFPQMAEAKEMVEGLLKIGD